MNQKYQIENEYGQILWDMAEIMKHPYSVWEFDVSTLVSENPFRGDPLYAVTTDLTQPLIVVNLSNGLDKLIDGTHRLYKAHKLGIKVIKAYYLSYEEHHRYIMDFHEKPTGIS